MVSNYEKLVFVLIAITISLLFLNVEPSLSQEPIKTILTLNEFKTSTFNGGQPIVFEGKLTTPSGDRVPYAKILIKNDGPCPANHVIAEGITDKHGRFWIYTITNVWDGSDNLIKVHAEFEGNEKFLPSMSEKHIVIVYPVKADACEN